MCHFTIVQDSLDGSTAEEEKPWVRKAEVKGINISFDLLTTDRTNNTKKKSSRAQIKAENDSRVAYDDLIFTDTNATNHLR